MKQIVFLFILWFISLSSSAIEKNQAVKTSTEGGRYEIVQSEILRKCCFKLDKYTGDVYQLVLNSNGEVTWQKMLVIGLSYDEIEKDTVNFQIFMSGIAASDSFMINIHTGRTYQLYSDANTDELYWSYVIEEK